MMKSVVKLSGIKLIVFLFILYIFFIIIFEMLFKFQIHQSQDDKFKWVAHTNSVIIESKDYLSSIQDAETNQMGYLLTLDKSYLTSYYRDVKQSESTLLKLSHLISDNPKQVDRLKKITMLTDEKLAELVETIELTNHNEAIMRVKENDGKQKMDAIRKILSEFIKEEEKLLDDREQVFNKGTSRNLFIMRAASYSLLLILFYFLYITLNQKNEIHLLGLKKELYRQLEEIKNALNEHAIIASTDIHGTITSVNDKFIEISGYSRDELIGNNHRIINSGHHTRDFWKSMYRTIINKETWNQEVCNRAKDGSLYWVSTTIMPIFNHNNDIKGYMAIRTDITQRKLYEEELIKAKEQAILSANAKSEFLANMSHEIRTPLNAIMGFIGILKEQEHEPVKLQYLETIDTSSQSLTNIINDILDFSKIESGKLNIEYMDFNLVKEFKATQDLFKAKCDEKSITLDVKYTNIPPFLHGDILRIKQVINNLLSNAIKFTAENKNILLHVEYKNDRLFVSVKDEGIGITKEYQEKIFDSFSQADSTTTRKYGGTGLGLSISSNLVKLMDGELRVTSELGIGSEFYFSLPLKIGKVIEASTKNVSVQDYSNLKILLVEDNKSNQLFMKVLFKKFNLTYDIANDGLEALEKFEVNTYDLIFMDENMPNMNGITATHHILKIEKEQNLKHTKIVALTANALKGDRERFLQAGMDDYLTKPLSQQMLIETLNKSIVMA